MTKFKDEQHKTLMLNCMKIIDCITEMQKIINDDKDLHEQLKLIPLALMGFSKKMIGK